MTATAQLTADLAQQVLRLEDDLRERVEQVPEFSQRWKADHAAARKADRTSQAWGQWRDERVTQVAVAWVLTTVFVRFCEDNELLRDVWIAGPGARAREAVEMQEVYFREHPEHTDREWLLQAVERLREFEATRGLVEEHSPLYLASPSGNAVTRLLDFWRERGDDGTLVHDLRDETLSTRFLGDLYQDLSDAAKKTYALLQTPEFVEEFILDQTLTPALEERPLAGFRLIDPACGSGHFLLGAFHRLLARWEAEAPELDARERTLKALDAIHGVDLNPFAVAITRFRLLLAAVQASGERSLERHIDFPLHLAAGDSLLFGVQGALALTDVEELGGHAYSTEDRELLDRLLTRGQYDVVVANPPYITVKDAALSAAYREIYKTCHRKYALTVPFMELIVKLARDGRGERPAGWTGQITSNSFMKRKFGTKLIEQFLADVDVQRVIDTSGAYIPGHGTPTVILVARHRAPQESTVRAVLGIQGEPGKPADPAKAHVWSSIVQHIDEPGYEDQWISVVDLSREQLARHPWSLTGGGADQLMSELDAMTGRLSERVESIGFAAITGEDEAFLAAGRHAPSTWANDGVPTRPFIEGEAVRDFHIDEDQWAAFPYDEEGPLKELAGRPSFWALRTRLRNGLAFGKTREDKQQELTEYILPNWPRLRAEALITFAFVATHNHFVLDRGGKVFNRSAPVIKLPAGASEDAHLELLGVLNSSVACFWLKQNSHNKGEGGGARVDAGFAARGEPFRESYEFTATTLENFPLPGLLSPERGRLLDSLAQDLSASSPERVLEQSPPTRELLAEAEARSAHYRGRMIAQQEELDWECYRLYGLLEADLTYDGDDFPEIGPAERAFAIHLARQVKAGQRETSWFTHWNHQFAPITEIPAHWPDAYRALVQRRLDLIESDRSIGLLEKPEYKRRWASTPWRVRERAALAQWLLGRLEDRKYWFDAQGTPSPQSVGQLADKVSREPELVRVLALWEGRPDAPVAATLGQLLTDASVPYLAAYRLKESGMRKREAWEEVWALQRREDAGERGLDIPVPPNYTSGDFRKQPWWQVRGKLDVPKERFILYPDAGRATDPTPMLGWAGWDHAQQALAIASLIAAREEDGASDDALVPLVAGLAELQPWVRQWHSGVDPSFGISLADFIDQQLAERMRQVGKSREELRAWRPAARTRGRKRA